MDDQGWSVHSQGGLPGDFRWEFPGVTELRVVSMAWPSGPLWFSGNYLASRPSQLPKDAPQTMERVVTAGR